MVLLFSSKVEGEPRFFTELEKKEEEKKVRLQFVEEKEQQQFFPHLLGWNFSCLSRL